MPRLGSRLDMSAPKDKGTLKPTQAPVEIREQAASMPLPHPSWRPERCSRGHYAGPGTILRRARGNRDHRPAISAGTWYQTPSSAIHFSSSTAGELILPTFGRGTSIEYVTRTFTVQASGLSQTGSSKGATFSQRTGRAVISAW